MREQVQCDGQYLTVSCDETIVPAALVGETITFATAQMSNGLNDAECKAAWDMVSKRKDVSFSIARFRDEVQLRCSSCRKAGQNELGCWLSCLLLP
jgi:hypothetical protein